MVRVGILSDSGQVGWQDLVLLAPPPRDVLAVSFGFDYTSSPEKKKAQGAGLRGCGVFGVFFPGEMQWGSRGKTRVALCTLGKHFVTLSLGKVTPGSNA